MQTCDLIVIGASQGGQALALHAAAQGRRVILFERQPHHHPNQARLAIQNLLALTRTLRQTQHLSSLGVTGSWETDLPRTLAQLWKAADQSSSIVEHEGLTLIAKQASFVGVRTVSDGAMKYQAPRIVISTGSVPLLPDHPSPVKGLAETPYLTPESLFELKKLPDRLAVLGAGRTGVQFAQAMAVLGCQVHLIERAERVLPRLSQTISQAIEQTLKADGVTLHLGHSITGVSYRDGRFTLRQADESEIITDALLLTPGDRPFTHLLDLKVGKVDTDELGHVQVSPQLETSSEGVFAIGSCVNQNVGQNHSWHDARRLIDQWDNTPRHVGDQPRAYGVATTPQVGHVGLWHEEAELAGYRIAQLQRPIQDGPMGEPSQEDQASLIEVLIDQPSGKLLGVTFVGCGAIDAAAMLSPLIARGRPWQDLAHCPMIPGSWGEHLQTLVRQFESAAPDTSVTPGA